VVVLAQVLVQNFYLTFLYSFSYNSFGIVTMLSVPI
jgi:hypothetical protein